MRDGYQSYKSLACIGRAGPLFRVINQKAEKPELHTERGKKQIPKAIIKSLRMKVLALKVFKIA